MATLAAQLHRSAPVSEQKQELTITYQRLMLLMLLFVGVTALIVMRLAQLQIFTDRSAGAELTNPLIPPRADIVDRNGIALARTIDAWTIGIHPTKVIGDRRELAVRLNSWLMWILMAWKVRVAGSFFAPGRCPMAFRTICAS